MELQKLLRRLVKSCSNGLGLGHAQGVFTIACFCVTFLAAIGCSAFPGQRLLAVQGACVGVSQEYLAHWVAKVASAEKEYCSATDQINRPLVPAAVVPQAAGKSSGTHIDIQ